MIEVDGLVSAKNEDKIISPEDLVGNLVEEAFHYSDSSLAVPWVAALGISTTPSAFSC